jgi:hypothetical protein
MLIRGSAARSVASFLNGSIVACVAGGLVVACGAPPPQQYSADPATYIATKARYVREARAMGGPRREFVDSALKDLETRLHAIVGPVAIDGRTPVLNLEWLPGFDPGGEVLDGLRFVNAGLDTTIIVTHRDLIVAWLREHGDTSSDPFVGLGREDMVTWAFWNNSHAYPYVDIRRKAPLPGEIVIAQLMSHSQDLPSIVPDELFVVVERGNRVFLIMAPSAKIAPPAECEKELSATSDTPYGRFDTESRVFRDCYDRVFTTTPEARRIIAQVRDLSASIPR